MILQQNKFRKLKVCEIQKAQEITNAFKFQFNPEAALKEFWNFLKHFKEAKLSALACFTFFWKIFSYKAFIDSFGEYPNL